MASKLELQLLAQSQANNYYQQRNNELKAQYDAWQKQQQSEALQKEYDAWVQSQQPAQAPAQTVQPEQATSTPKANTIPSIADFSDDFSAQQNLKARIERRELAKNGVGRAEGKGIKHSRSNKAADYAERLAANQKEYEDWKAQKQAEKPTEDITPAQIEQNIANLDAYTDGFNTNNQSTPQQQAIEERIANEGQYNTTTPVQDKVNDQAAKKFANDYVQNQLALTTLKDLYPVQNAESSTEDVIGSGVDQIANLADYQKAIDEAKAQGNVERLALADNSDELAQIEQNIANLDAYTDDFNRNTTNLNPEQQALEQQILNEGVYQNNAPIGLNNPQELADIINATGQGIMKIPYTIASPIADVMVNQGETVGQLGASALDTITGNQDTKKYQNIVDDYFTDKRQQVEENKQWIRESREQAKEEHPFAYGAGNMATQALLYYLTNGTFDKIGAALGGNTAASMFIGNQVGQNLQDVALDTLPRAYELASDGDLSQEDINTLLQEAKWNAAGNLGIAGLQILGEKGVPAFLKWLYNGGTENVTESAAKSLPTSPAKEVAKQIPSIDNVTDIYKNTEDILNITKRVDEMDEVFSKLDSDLTELAKPMNSVAKSGVMDRVSNPTALKNWQRLQDAYSNYVDALINEADNESRLLAKKEMENARKAFGRSMANVDPEVAKMFDNASYGKAVGRPLNTVNTAPIADEAANENLKAILRAEGYSEAEIDNMLKTVAEQDAMYKQMDEYAENITKQYGNQANAGYVDALDNNAANVDKVAETVENTAKATNPEGSNPLQTFAKGSDDAEWKTSKFRTNTAESMGWGKNPEDLPAKDYAYRVYSEAEQNADAIDRYKDSQNIMSDLLSKDYDSFDEVDVKAAMNEIQSLMDQGNTRDANRLAKRLAYEGREGGRKVQAFAEYNKNTAGGALQEAAKVQEDDVLKPWKSKNKKKADGNNRIAKALADMGNKWNVAKETPVLTHDQIKKGVIAELEKEVGSVEKYFNDSDIEFLTQLAEDKSIPVWQITSEIEHKLKYGNWYTLDESVELPKPTNRKLQNALNSLVTEQVRVEKPAPTLKQITEEVKNTFAKESSAYEGLFSNDDMEYLANLISSGATKEELADALNLKMATGSFGISDETLQEVNNIFKQISQYDVNSKQFVEGQAEAYRLLANELVPNATALEKFETWRYLAMLGNPKTMLRNFVGNQTFGLVTGISNNIAALGEAGVDKLVKGFGGEGIQRTKAILNPLQDADLIKASAIDADASRYRQIVGSKYEKMDKDTLRQSRSVFKSKLLQLYEKATDAGISDYKAVKNKFSTSLAGYLKANGYDQSIFDAELELNRLRNLGETRLLSDAERETMDELAKEVAVLDKGRDFALKQAEYATFHEDNVIASLLSKWSREARNSDSLVGKGLGTIIEGTVPFKKTPANVLKSGIDYSLLGAIDSIKKTGKLIYENTGKRAGNLADVYTKKTLTGGTKEVARTLASDVIDSWSKTLTGTGLTALGYYLYNKGILNLSDPDLKYQDQLEGHQNYALEINGKSYTIDWAAPTAMPLFLGAELAKVFQATGQDEGSFYNSIDDYIAAVNRMADPLVELSMLQGVKDTIETAANSAQYNENLNVPALVGYNALTGYLSQGVPTLLGQVARTVDPTRRSTYTDKEGAVGVIDKQLKKQMNKIPGLSTLNQPYVDTYGRQQNNSPFDNPLANLGYQMFSPGYLSDINVTDADRVSRQAYENSNNEKTLPKWQSSIKIGGQRVSPEDYTKGSLAYGQAQYEIRTALANDEWFNSLTPAEQEEFVKGINTLAEHVGKAAIDPEYSTSAKAYEAYKNGGAEGLIEYYKAEQGKSVAKESGLSSSSKASKEIQEDVQNGNIEAAQQKVDDAQSLASLGLDKPGPTYTYYKAQEQIPGLTTEQFANTYKSIDANSNQGITQDELIDFLNKSGVSSESEAMKYWNAYGNSDWKSIPSLKDGKWKKKKK